MTRTAALLYFDEREDYMLPVDSAGNLAPAAPPAGFTAPSSDDAVVGRGRTWTTTLQGFEAAEAVAGALKFNRDVTLEAVCELPWATTNGTYRLVTRGRSGSAAERELYGLQVVVTGAPGAPVVSLQMRWQRTGGAAATVAAVAFSPPAGWWYLAATRRWISSAECEVKYFVNGLHIGTVTSVHGDIAEGEGDGGHLLIGCDTVAGLPAGSKLDDLRISGLVRSPEEVRWMHRAMFVFPAYGYELVKASLPPGDSYSGDPESQVQRELMLLGDALGQAWAKAAEIGDDFLPDRAWSFLDRWVALTRLPTALADSIDTIRARVVGFLRKVHGYNRDEILEAVLDLLDATAAQLQVVRKSQYFTEAFAGVAPAALWTQEANAGTIVVAAGVCTLALQAGDDGRWDGAVRKAVSLRTSLEEVDHAEIIASVAPTLGENGAAVGLFVFHAVTGDAHLFGIKRDGGVNKWWHGKIVAGALTEVLGAAVPAGTTYWLRYIDRGATVDLDYRVDGSGFDGPWTTVFDAVASTTPRYWVGIFCSSSVNPVVTGSSGAFADFRTWTPRGRGAFNWFIYRDPAIGGTPDILGAQLVLNNMMPAHSRGFVSQALTLLFDDADGGFDTTPLGA